MSLLIEGMDMPPKGTYKAEFYVDENGARLLVDLPEPFVGFAQRLVREIPTHHGRLIDADKLKVAVLEAMCRGIDVSITQLIDKVPTVIEKEEK